MAVHSFHLYGKVYGRETNISIDLRKEFVLTINQKEKGEISEKNIKIWGNVSQDGKRTKLRIVNNDLNNPIDFTQELEL